MDRFEQLKAEINAMSLDDFMKHFVSGQGMKDYICGVIDSNDAECCRNDDYTCVHCIRKHLESEVTK